MAMQKLYAGAKLRECRRKNALTQKDFASKLGVSVPYFNQMENNRRPLNASVLAGLAQKFGLERGHFDPDNTPHLLADLRAALSDPGLSEAPAPEDLRQMVDAVPALARVVVELHRGASRRGLDGPSPWREARAFFDTRGPYFDALDRAGEAFSRIRGRHSDIRVAAASKLGNRGITLEFAEMGRLRHFDAERKLLRLSLYASPTTQNFQMLVQVALSTQGALLDVVLDDGGPEDPKARDLARLGLAKYFAGAALLPYRRFLKAARDTRHDLDVLAAIFDASPEQVAHRLATLRRPDQAGVPFRFARVDQTGIVTKEIGNGVDPCGAIYQAFETPGWVRQELVQTEQCAQIGFAREITRRRPGLPLRRSAIALTCDRAHGAEIIYADRLNPEAV